MNIQRSVKTWTARTLAVVLAATASAAAVAQSDPRVLITVDRADGSEEVSLSRAPTKKNTLQLDTYAAFKVTVTNGATNTLNRVFFNGTAVGDGMDLATWDSFIATKPGDSCTGSGNTVSCKLESLNPGDGTSFTVIFITPRTGSSLDLSWTGGGFEGNGGGNGCCSQLGASKNKVKLVDPTTDDLSLYKTRASTFMRPLGFTLFTGPQAVTTSSDGWSTIITVPEFVATTYTKASIFEDNPAQSCQPYVVGQGCFSSDVNIPNFAVTLPNPVDPAKLLQITIRWDKSFFNLGNTKPADVKLYYVKDPSLVTQPSPYPYQLQLCSVTPPAPGLPCLAVAPRILKNTDTADKDLWGDLEFNVWALENGRYAN